MLLVKILLFGFAVKSFDLFVIVDVFKNDFLDIIVLLIGIFLFGFIIIILSGIMFFGFIFLMLLLIFKFV